MRKNLILTLVLLAGGMAVGEENLPWVEWTWTPPTVSSETGTNAQAFDSRWYTALTVLGGSLSTRLPTGLLMLFW